MCVFNARVYVGLGVGWEASQSHAICRPVLSCKGASEVLNNNAYDATEGTQNVTITSVVCAYFSLPALCKTRLFPGVESATVPRVSATEWVDCILRETDGRPATIATPPLQGRATCGCDGLQSSP